jgi:hypothetical protein
VLESHPPPACLTDAQKASCHIAHEQQKLAAKKLDDAIKAFTEDQYARVEELSKAHNVKDKKIKDLVRVYTHFKKAQKPNLWNAIVHVNAMEINQGRWLQDFLASIMLTLQCRTATWSEAQACRTQGSRRTRQKFDRRSGAGVS